MTALCENRSSVNTDRRPPTFLIGAARSGTSLLYKGLCLHPDAAYFNNNYVRRLPRHPGDQRYQPHRAA